eukprot:PhM_4_TR2060/c0_g1_i7/m.99955
MSSSHSVKTPLSECASSGIVSVMDIADDDVPVTVPQNKCNDARRHTKMTSNGPTKQISSTSQYVGTVLGKHCAVASRWVCYMHLFSVIQLLAAALISTRPRPPPAS